MSTHTNGQAALHLQRRVPSVLVSSWSVWSSAESSCPSPAVALWPTHSVGRSWRPRAHTETHKRAHTQTHNQSKVRNPEHLLNSIWVNRWGVITITDCRCGHTVFYWHAIFTNMTPKSYVVYKILIMKFIFLSFSSLGWKHMNAIWLMTDYLSCEKKLFLWEAEVVNLWFINPNFQNFQTDNLLWEGARIFIMSLST